MDLNKTDNDDEQFSGNELDEPGAGVQFSGNELNDTGGNDNLAEKAPLKPDSATKKSLKDDSSKGRDDTNPADETGVFVGKKKNLIVYKISAVAILVFLIISAVYFFFLRKPETKNNLISTENKSAAVEKKALVFETYIVHFENNKYYSYMLVDVSFDISERKLSMEITEKQYMLRKIIYDILLKEIKDAESIPQAADIKKYIKTGINEALENGKIQEVFITKYNAV